MGLMDYNGSLQEANDLVTIHLWDLRSFRQHIDDVLAWPLLSYEKTRWKSRREWFDYMGSCRNDEFTFGGVSIRLPETMLAGGKLVLTTASNLFYIGSAVALVIGIIALVSLSDANRRYIAQLPKWQQFLIWPW